MKDPTYEADARTEARRVLEEACVTRADQIDIEAIAERMNAEIVYTDLDGATASVMRIGDRARIRTSNRVQHIGSQRFVGAHEIGIFVSTRGRTATCAKSSSAPARRWRRVAR
jgi:hypothetical protein